LLREQLLFQDKNRRTRLRTTTTENDVNDITWGDDDVGTVAVFAPTTTQEKTTLKKLRQRDK